jgi:hypothetical protein
LALLALVAACEDPDTKLNLFNDAGGDEEAADGDTDESTDPHEVADARVRDARAQEEPDAAEDPGAMMPLDAGPPAREAGLPEGSLVVSNNEAGIPVVVSPPKEATQALCTDAYDSVKLAYANVTRGSWQLNPGGTSVQFAMPSYPCLAFLEEKKTRPPADDKRWTDATDGAFLGFNEVSTITTTDYTRGQFRYFRSFIYVPKGANLKNLSVSASGIDDSVYLELTNKRYPKGISPLDVGPSEMGVGACQGNGMGEWNLAKYIAEDEVNVLLLVHADLSAATSTLSSVDIRADGAPIQLVSCKK